MAVRSGSGSPAKWIASRIGLTYLVVGFAWILLSDQMTAWWVGANFERFRLIETYKGYLFITGTAALITGLVYLHVRRVIAAERSQRESEAQFRNAFEHAVTGMALVSPSLTVTRANDVLCEMLGYDQGELVGRHIGDLTHPADREERLQYLRDMLAERTQTRQMELRCLRREGGFCWVLANSTLQRDDAGQPLYFISQVVDVTAWRQAEERARQQQMELARAARLITVGEMSSGLAHELNQPLGAILHYSETCKSALQERNESMPRELLLEAMEDVVRQAERARQIVQRVRGMARKQTPRATPCDVNRILRDALDLLEPQLARARVACRLNLADGLPEVAADPVQIGQVLVNLAGNAIEAVAEQPTENRWIELRTRRDGNRVQVAVCDGGRELPPDVVPRLFDQFFTTKEDGLGLGLAISRSIVANHGGRLTMQRVDARNEFEFYLTPATEATWLLENHLSG